MGGAPVSCPHLSGKHLTKCALNGRGCRHLNLNCQDCVSFHIASELLEVQRLRRVTSAQASIGQQARATLPPCNEPRIAQGGAILEECSCG